jgi:Tol biopolymer transport system component
MYLVAIVARVGASVEKAGLFSPCPLAKKEQRGWPRPITGGALTVAAGTLVAVGLVVLIMLVVVEARPAEATFPGKNGRIAYDANGVIYTVHPDGSGKTRVTNPTTGSPDYSPNGKKITYTSYAQIDAEIYTINVDGTGKFRLTNNNRSDVDSAYSPDGKRIAYSHWDGHDGEIYTINTDGTGKVQVTNNSTNDFTHSYSPDGKKIVYSTHSGLHGKIYTINVGGGGKSKVTEGVAPSWGSRP